MLGRTAPYRGMCLCMGVTPMEARVCPCTGFSGNFFWSFTGDLLIMMLELAAMCLSLNIYYEARNQPLRGQMAVAEVVLNRVTDERFPDTVCEVVMQGPTYSWKPDFPIRHKCQFSWYCDGKSDTPTETEAWNTSVIVAENILANVPPKLLEGATHYHAVEVAPSWAKKKTFIRRIGDHLFYK